MQIKDLSLCRKTEWVDGRLLLAKQSYNRVLNKTKFSIVQLNRLAMEIIQEGNKFMKVYSQTRCDLVAL
jgi:hypothetical protein